MCWGHRPVPSSSVPHRAQRLRHAQHLPSIIFGEKLANIYSFLQFAAIHSSLTSLYLLEWFFFFFNLVFTLIEVWWYWQICKPIPDTANVKELRPLYLTYCFYLVVGQIISLKDVSIQMARTCEYVVLLDSEDSERGDVPEVFHWARHNHSDSNKRRSEKLEWGSREEDSSQSWTCWDGKSTQAMGNFWNLEKFKTARHDGTHL